MMVLEMGLLQRWHRRNPIGRFSPIGQGFMIEGSATGNVVMKIIIEFL
jgi:hypothetical protein